MNSQMSLAVCVAVFFTGERCISKEYAREVQALRDQQDSF